MTYYKLTDKNGETRDSMKWPIGKTNHAIGGGKELCTDGYLHVYDTPEQAVFMRPVHVSEYTRLFEVRSRCKGITDGTKRGVKNCTVVREIDLPTMTTEQRIEIAIRVSLLVYKNERYTLWAENWLNGKDRSEDAATDAAAYAAADAGAYAADAAMYAACAVNAVMYAACAVNAATYAACATKNKPLPLVDIINRVIGRSESNHKGELL